MIPRKQSLVHQVASILRNGIRNGLWIDWLPSERALCETYKVSRNTLRAAINRLESEGVLAAVHGKGTRITGTPQHVECDPNREAVVGLINSRAIEQVRSTTAIWIDGLRERLFEAGLLLKIYHGSKYFRQNPGPALESLHKRHSSSCWILPDSTRPMQEWFEASQIPCVIAGSTYEGIALPSVDIDYRALCRHAVGIMLSRGHRRICMLNPETTNPGDLEGEAGFQEGLDLSRQDDLIAAVFRHGNALHEICHTIDHILKVPEPPTAILVAKTYVYLTLVSRAAQLGLRVPEDISLVCRDADPFLQFLTPGPTLYSIDPTMYATKLLRSVVGVIDGDISGNSKTLILPDFKSGQSLARPREVTAA